MFFTINKKPPFVVFLTNVESTEIILIHGHLIFIWNPTYVLISFRLCIRHCFSSFFTEIAIKNFLPFVGDVHGSLEHPAVTSHWLVTDSRWHTSGITTWQVIAYTGATFTDWTEWRVRHIHDVCELWPFGTNNTIVQWLSWRGIRMHQRSFVGL